MKEEEGVEGLTTSLKVLCLYIFKNHKRKKERVSECEEDTLGWAARRKKLEAAFKGLPPQKGGGPH